MNYRKILALFICVLALSYYSCQKTDQKSASKQEITKQKLLRHVVLFKFNDSVDAASVEKMNAAFTAIPEAIPEIKDFEWGLNDSPEDFHQGFTHCYLITF